MVIQRRRRPLPAAALILVVLVSAGCGSSSSSSTGKSSASASATSSGAASSSASGPSSATVAAHGSKFGQILTDAHGKALYLWVADKGTRSVCYGSCAKAWPPLTVTGKPSAGSGVDTARLGTSKRKDGTLQVTYAGHPLYYFVGDTGPGTESGQGSSGFGAKWWLVSPSGKAITASSGASAPSSSSSGSGGY